MRPVASDSQFSVTSFGTDAELDSLIRDITTRRRTSSAALTNAVSTTTNGDVDMTEDIFVGEDDKGNKGEKSNISEE
jgi:hypothetical protein